MTKLGLAMIAFLSACGGIDTFEEHESSLEQELTSQRTDNTVPFTLGCSGIQNGAACRQAPPSASDSVVMVPASRGFSLSFSGFQGATTTRQVKDAFTRAGSALTRLTGYGYEQVDSNAYIKVQAISSGRTTFDPVPGQPDRVDIHQFVKAQCKQGTVLSEPTSVSGVYVRHALGSDACTISVDVARLNLYCRGNASCFVPVMEHGAGYALAAIGGLGSCATCVSTNGFMTGRAVNQAVSMLNLPTAQTCLASSMTGVTTNSYSVKVTPQCPNLPAGY